MKWAWACGKDPPSTHAYHPIAEAQPKYVGPENGSETIAFPQTGPAKLLKRFPRLAPRLSGPPPSFSHPPYLRFPSRPWQHQGTQGPTPFRPGGRSGVTDAATLREQRDLRTDACCF